MSGDKNGERNSKGPMMAAKGGPYITASWPRCKKSTRLSILMTPGSNVAVHYVINLENIE